MATHVLVLCLLQQDLRGVKPARSCQLAFMMVLGWRPRNFQQKWLEKADGISNVLHVAEDIQVYCIKESRCIEPYLDRRQAWMLFGGAIKLRFCADFVQTNDMLRCYTSAKLHHLRGPIWNNGVVLNVNQVVQDFVDFIHQQWQFEGIGYVFMIAPARRLEVWPASRSSLVQGNPCMYQKTKQTST